MGIFWCISITFNVNSYKKINEKAQTAKFTVFAREISSAVLKTWKTRKTKTWITQNFQILYHIQGTTMWTSTSSAFRKCGTFGVYDFLKGSYWLSKSRNFSFFFLKFDLTLTVNNSPLKTATLKKYHIFGNLRTSAFQWCPLDMV